MEKVHLYLLWESGGRGEPSMGQDRPHRSSSLDRKKTHSIRVASSDILPLRGTYFAQSSPHIAWGFCELCLPS